MLLRWKDNPQLPNGLVYEGVNDEPVYLSGCSAAQSSAVQSFDAILGVQHEEKSGNPTDCNKYGRSVPDDTTLPIKGITWPPRSSLRQRLIDIQSFITFFYKKNPVKRVLQK